MQFGTVKWFNDPKGWGFISLHDGRDVFVHYSKIAGRGRRTLVQGERVELDIEMTPRGLMASLVLREAGAPAGRTLGECARLRS